MSGVTLVVYKSCAQLPTMHAHHRCRVAIALSLYCRKMLVMLLLQMRDLHFVRDNRHKPVTRHWVFVLWWELRRTTGAMQWR